MLEQDKCSKFSILLSIFYFFVHIFFNSYQLTKLFGVTICKSKCRCNLRQPYSMLVPHSFTSNFSGDREELREGHSVRGRCPLPAIFSPEAPIPHVWGAVSWGAVGSHVSMLFVQQIVFRNYKIYVLCMLVTSSSSKIFYIFFYFVILMTNLSLT